MQKRVIFSLFTLALFPSLACSSTDFYTGLGLGVSSLSPDINEQEQDAQRNFAGTLFLGKDISSYTAIEGSYSYLSSYDLNGSDDAVEYQNYGLSGLLYWPSSSSEWSLYGKLGANYLDGNFKGSAGNLNVEHKVSLASGLGIRWNLNENWFARLEYNLYDSDYSAAFIQVARTLGKNSKQTQVVETQTDSELRKVSPVVEVPEPIAISEVFDKVTLSSGPFQSDSSDLEGLPVQALSKLVAILKRYPEAKVEVVGHTDSRGSESYNQSLSLQRATSVAHFFESVGIESSRITIDGIGETQPVAPNTDKEGRAKNRRVEITIPQFEYLSK
jgi:OOP family OmpA-OmpF porin